jgi:hypothetical protein
MDTSFDPNVGPNQRAGLFELRGYNKYGPPGGGFGAGGASASAGSGGGSGGAGGSGGPINNNAATNPDMKWLIDKYKDRFSPDTTKREIDRSNAGITDAAALLNKDAQAGLAQRGARNSGVAGAFIQKHITDPAQRQAAGAAADIAQNNERRLDQLTMAGSGIVNAPAQLQLEQQRLALQQYQTNAQLEMQRSQQQQAQLLALLNGL